MAFFRRREPSRKKKTLEYYTQFNGINFFNQIPLMVVTAVEYRASMPKTYFSGESKAREKEKNWVKMNV
jgi:hypothetical protein